MMPTGWLGMGCAVLSAAGVAILAATDPKRRREVRRTAWSHAPRWLVVLAVFAPGIALGSARLWVELLIWVGAAAILGWAIAAMSNVQWRRRKGKTSWRRERHTASLRRP